MFRARLNHIVAALAIAPVLAGCTGPELPSFVPDWLKGKPPATPTQVLQLVSVPPGADARTEQGLTCLTPCTLAVPIANQSVTFVLNGYAPQIAQVELSETGELKPNPVAVTLGSNAMPSKPMKSHKKPRPRPKTAASQVAPPPPVSAAPPPSSPFPPPPQR
jgi:hypothetical protein